MRGTAQVIFIVGKRNSGKTVLARALLRRSECGRSLCYDSNGHDYKDGVICDGLELLKRYWRSVIGGSFRLIFRSINPRKDFETVCRLVMAAGNMVLTVDECDMYFSDGDPGEAFGDLIRRGRHADVELIGITQRPREMGELRSMANAIYIFETHEPSDLDYFKRAFSDKLIAMIKQLKQYEYVRVMLPYDESTLEICKEAYAGANTGEVYQQPSPGGSLGLQPGYGDPAGQTE